MWYDKFPITDKKLGYIYCPEQTVFRVWSPIKNQIALLLYPHPFSIERESHIMSKGEDGVHEVTISRNLKGYYYTFLIDGKFEVTDPYSVAASLNSIRSAVVDLETSNPDGWEDHTIPYHKRNCDAIVYEVNVKDFTVSHTSGAIKRGTYLGFVEHDTRCNGVTTGISHLKELGVTHIHIMPVYDFLTVREDQELFLAKRNYNWGYDPELYNVPEGSYATNPKDPISRIKDLKTMIMELHSAGFKVILDVVYNHTYRTYDSNFNTIMPSYYYRQNHDGSFSNGSGCGNELATERPMVRKFIVDSILYWVNEYKVDGFRFDLMALMDIDTTEEILSEVRKARPDIFIYGEPWAGGITTLSYNNTTSKGTQSKLSFGLFNDNFRDALKGDNDGDAKGFSQGNLDSKLATETGIAGSIYYDDGHIGFASNPRETINYLNSHDNLIITDKMKKVFPVIDKNEMERLNRFAFSILLTSQGIPFIHAGNEFLRSKNMAHNSYNLDIDINGIDWSLKETNLSFYNYFKDLIQLRMSNKVFRMTSVDDIKKRLKFINYQGISNLIAYTLETQEDKYLLVIHNGNHHVGFLTRVAIKDHITNSYGIICNDCKIRLIFDEKGLIKSYKNGNDSYGIEVPYFSTYICEISQKK